MPSKNSLDTNYPVEVAAGGTGDSTFVTYTPICGGTTATNPLQSVAALNATGNVLLSNGAGALPTFQPVGNNPGLVPVAISDSNHTNVPIEFALPATYTDYLLFFDLFYNANDSRDIIMSVSTDNGASYVNNGYNYAVNYLGFGTTGPVNNINGTNAGNFQLSPLISDLNPRYYGRVNLYNTNNGSFFCYSGEAMFNAPGGTYRASVFGANTNNLTVNKIKVSFNDGTWVGKLTLYGLRKS